MPPRSVSRPGRTPEGQRSIEVLCGLPLNCARIAVCSGSEATELAAVGRDGDRGHESAHDEQRLALLSHLPRDALIEPVVRFWLDLGVGLARRGVLHRPQRWSASLRQTRC